MSDKKVDLTPAEIRKFKKAFQLFDTKGKGIVSYRDYATLLRGLGQNPTEKDLKETCAALDPDKSGFVKFPGFLEDISKRIKVKENPDELTESFKVFDKDGHGQISTAEFAHVMQTLGETFTEAEVAEMIKVADKNNDGHINYSEFMRAFAR
eukprot:TRINITY_DN10307_c0_g1_i9.p1 TRINITY_DN10307_c0_g1~~TRINITY_DN10307_c0_g1_i9.p1  ORF type:complete len:152 (-),score=28.68 TRINITY_DN10307_c0_g1_i9:209-664(-)